MAYSILFNLSLWSEVKVIQSRLTLCDPMDYMVHGILQARILEWVAFSFSRESSQPRNQTQVSLIVGRFFTSWTTRDIPWENHNSKRHMYTTVHCNTIDNIQDMKAT